MKLEASVTNTDATFDDERIEIPSPDPLQLSTVPAITNFRIVESPPGKLALTANVHCCPTNAGALEVLVKTGGDQALTAKDRRKTIDSQVKKLRVSYPPGATLDGELSAELDKTALEAGKTCDFEIAGADDEIFGVKLTPPATASYTDPAAAATGGP